MKSLLVAVLLAGSVWLVAPASAADGCGPGCHSALYGGCVVDGWEIARPVYLPNECPVATRPGPSCPYGYRWKLGTCFPN